MGLDGEKMLRGLSRLGSVTRMADVRPLSYALFPGYHCPLMGCMLTLSQVSGAAMLVLGPDECAYYTKMATDSSGAMGARGCRIVSVVMDPHDVTFGAAEALTEAIRELAREDPPKALFVISTCVPEVTGEDAEAVCETLEDEVGFPILVIHAENFRTDDHLPGIERTLTACIRLMEAHVEPDSDSSVNVLGMRLGDFRRTEVHRLLQESGVEAALQLPGACSVDNIAKAPDRKLNLVVHPVGLPLAKRMKQRFGTPYVVFERVSDPVRIRKAYEELFTALGKPLPAEAGELYRQAERQTEAAAQKLRGKSYISGNTALCNWELHAFLTRRLGLNAALIQTSELGEEDEKYRREILPGCNPYVSRAANLGALRYLYPILKPDFNLGAGNPREMAAAGTRAVMMPRAYNTLGFEVNTMVTEAFTRPGMLP